jgi:hypothetical protein
MGTSVSKAAISFMNDTVGALIAHREAPGQYAGSPGGQYLFGPAWEDYAKQNQRSADLMAFDVVKLAQEKADVKLSAWDKHIYAQWVLMGNIDPLEASDIVAEDNNQAADESLGRLVNMMSQDYGSQSDFYSGIIQSQGDTATGLAQDSDSQTDQSADSNQVRLQAYTAYGSPQDSGSQTDQSADSNQVRLQAYTEYGSPQDSDSQEVRAVISRVYDWSQNPESQVMGEILSDILDWTRDSRASSNEDRDSNPGNPSDDSTPV